MSVDYASLVVADLRRLLAAGSTVDATTMVEYLEAVVRGDQDPIRIAGAHETIPTAEVNQAAIEARAHLERWMTVRDPGMDGSA